MHQLGTTTQYPFVQFAPLAHGNISHTWTSGSNIMENQRATAIPVAAYMSGVYRSVFGLINANVPATKTHFSFINMAKISENACNSFVIHQNVQKKPVLPKVAIVPKLTITIDKAVPGRWFKNLMWPWTSNVSWKKTPHRRFEFSGLRTENLFQQFHYLHTSISFPPKQCSPS